MKDIGNVIFFPLGENWASFKSVGELSEILM